MTRWRWIIRLRDRDRRSSKLRVPIFCDLKFITASTEKKNWYFLGIKFTVWIMLMQPSHAHPIKPQTMRADLGISHFWIIYYYHYHCGSIQYSNVLLLLLFLRQFLLPFRNFSSPLVIWSVHWPQKVFKWNINEYGSQHKNYCLLNLRFNLSIEIAIDYYSLLL